MMTSPNRLAGYHNDTPQSPFQQSGPPAVPLFVRDRYGSADSTATMDSIDKEMHDIDTDDNPWAGATGSYPVDQISEKESTSESSSAGNLVDGGFKAWSILAGAFLFEALIWGFPLSYGVFQSYYFSSPTSPFKGNSSSSYIGTISTGIFFLGAPLMTYLVEKLPQHRRLMICAGWPLCIAALLGGSFATTIPALIGTQGILYALGELILYIPLMSIINEYFLEKRGLAFGIVTCSTGITGIALPFLSEYLLTKLGYANTLQIFALILTVTTGPLLLVLKPRLTNINPPTSISLTFLRQPLFWLYTLSNTAHSTILFLPAIFLPQFATTLGLSSTIGALLLALLSIGQITGQITFGFLSDHSSSSSKLSIPLNVLILTTSLFASISAFTLWGLASNLACLIPFALVFGFFANGYTVLWPRMGMVLASLSPETDSSDSSPVSSEKSSGNSTTILTTFGLFSFQKGIGALIAGPVSTRLLEVDSAVLGGRLVQYAAGGRFVGIVLFTGTGALLSALLVAGWYVVPRRYRPGSGTS